MLNVVNQFDEFARSHGDVEPEQYDFGYSNSEISEVRGSTHINNDYNEAYVDRIEYMVDDGIMAYQNVRDEVSRDTVI